MRSFSTDGEEEFQKGLEYLKGQGNSNIRQSILYFSKVAEKVVRCLEIAAENGLSCAKYQLALCCYYGVGTKKDEKSVLVSERGIC